MTIIGAVHMVKYLKAKKKIGEGKKCYEDRKTVLAQLGYATYQEYLAGEEWADIRAERLGKFPDCLLCGERANQVHHMEYSDRVLLGIERRLLVTLCGDCHKRIEWDGEIKRSLEDANKTLRELAFERGNARWLRMIKSIGKQKHRSKGKEGDTSSGPGFHPRCKVCLKIIRKKQIKIHGDRCAKCKKNDALRCNRCHKIFNEHSGQGKGSAFCFECRGTRKHWNR